MTDADLSINGGVVVTSAGRRRANVHVRDGRIAFIGPEPATAARVVDATGLLVLPGAVDTHVHLMDPGATEREDFPSGTAAAAASGVTTLIEHTHAHPIRTVDDFHDKRQHLLDRSEVDFALAAHAWPGFGDQVGPLWAAGIAFFKLFTCTTHGVPGHSAAQLQAHLRRCAVLDAPTLLHCEDESLTEDAEAMLRADGRTDGGVVPEWRNRDAELVAVSVAALIVRLTGARATVAHISSPPVARAVAEQRRLGARLAAESCPQYFLLREDEVLEQEGLRKFTPPARARHERDEEAMWGLLRAGRLTHMSTDHAPATLEQKHAGDIWSVVFGLPGLDSTMPLLLDAALSGRLALEDLVRVYAEFPAQWYGLAGRKGALRVGADADVVLVDPSAGRMLRNADVLSKAGWTPYDGRAVTGRVVQTYLRGRLIAQEGRPLRERTGEFVTGPGCRS